MSTKTDLRLPEQYRALEFPDRRGTWSDIAHVLNIPNTEAMRYLGKAASWPRRTHWGHRPSFEAAMQRADDTVAVRFKDWNAAAAGAWSALQLYKDMQGPERGLTELALEDLNPEMRRRAEASSPRHPYFRSTFGVSLSASTQATAIRVAANPTRSVPALLCSVKETYDALYENSDHSDKVSGAVGAISLRRFCDGWELAYGCQVRGECTPAEAARAFLYNAGVFEAQPS